MLKVLPWAVSLSCFLTTTAGSEQPNVLNSKSHPASPAYNNVFDNKVAPLDAKLSWTKRFKGDARFDTKHSHDSTDHSAMTTAKPESDGITSKPGKSSPYDAEGLIKRIDTSSRKLKISHSPIEKFAMPAMTMMFEVATDTDLSELKKGDRIRFNVADTDGGFVISRLASVESEPTAASEALDADGVVQSIRGKKIKISHGPILKFGMPPMTMLFSVDDSVDLEGIETGTAIRFTVDDTPGGFVIRQIVPQNP